MDHLTCLDHPLTRNSLSRLFHALTRTDKALLYRSLFAFLSIGLLIYLAFIKLPARYGDAYEYLYTSQAFLNHASPDLRAGDIESLRGALGRVNIPVSEKPIGFYPAFSGAVYSYHFWLYSALVAPLMAVWDALFANPIRAFPAFNTLLFLLALWAFELSADIDRHKKTLALGLMAFNPILWYLSWWHPEGFTYSLLLLSLTAFTRQRHALAAALAALAATQNQPALFGAFFFGCAGLVEIWKRKKFLDVLKFIPAGLIAILPSIFYWVNYGTPNLILSLGWADVKLISLQRVYDLLYDLNLGVLAFLPAVALLFSACLLSDLIRRRWKQIFIPIVLLAMLLSASQTTNWNPGMAGIHRYAIWLVPWLVFYIFNRPLLGWVKWIAAGGIAAQMIIFISFGGFTQNVSYTRFTPVGQMLMDLAPTLYSPDPEIFYERSKDSEGVVGSSPTLYASPQGVVKKMWTDLAGFEKLVGLNNLALDIADPQRYREIKAQLAASPGSQYVNFDTPVILLKADPLFALNQIQYNLALEGLPAASTPLADAIALKAMVSNAGETPWFSLQGKNPLLLTYQWVAQDGSAEKFSVRDFRLPAIILPGEMIDYDFRLPYPPRPGEYLLELDILWKDIARFSDLGNPKPSFHVTFTAP
jgi:hypothetical protein